MKALIEHIKANPALAIASVLAAIAFFGMIYWFYAALDAQMRALEAGIGTY